MLLSPRERYDWLLLGGMTLIVYATVLPMRLVFDAITRAGYLATVQNLVIAMVFCVGVGVFLWMVFKAKERDPRRYLELMGAGLGAVAILWLLTEMPIERVHLLEYGVIGWAAWRAVGHRISGPDRVLIGGLLAMNIGLGDELVQGLLPMRFYDPKDVLVNGVAGAIGVWMSTLINRVRFFAR